MIITQNEPVYVVSSHQLPVSVCVPPTPHDTNFWYIFKIMKRYISHSALRFVNYLNIAVHFCFAEEGTVSNRLLSCTAGE